MGLLNQLISSGPQLFVGLLLLAIIVGVINRRFSKHKLVLRAYHVGFEPLADDPEVNGHPLSQPVMDLRSGEATYVAIVGRPAGLVNFLRESFGIARRFEFLLCKRQAILRTGSLTQHTLQCAKLSGISSCEVGQTRMNPFVVLFRFMIAAVVINVFIGGIFDAEGGYPLLTFLVFCGFAYYWFITKITEMTLSEAGDDVIAFEIYPPLLERVTGGSGLDLPSTEANRIVQIFRVLKDA